MSLRSDLRRVSTQLDELDRWIVHADRASTSVSAWSIGDHIDHCCRATISMARVMTDPDPRAASVPLSTPGRLVLTTGWIPRGKGRSPNAALPGEHDPAALREGCEEVRRIWAKAIETDLRSPTRVGRHHYFGGLTRARWVRFAGVHLHHHLKIVWDIAGRREP